MAISDEQFVNLTTFKKDGSSKEVPVWIADLGDGKIGFTTASSSYKVKRLNNDPRVELQPSDRKGAVTPGSEKVTGTAVAEQGAEFERVEAIVKKKYGFMFTMIGIIGKAAKLVGKGSGTDTAVIITLD